MDIYIRQQNLTALVQLLNDFGMSFSYLIDDVQDAVNKENPSRTRAGRFSYSQYNSLSSVGLTRNRRREGRHGVRKKRERKAGTRKGTKLVFSYFSFKSLYYKQYNLGYNINLGFQLCD